MAHVRPELRIDEAPEDARMNREQGQEGEHQRTCAPSFLEANAADVAQRRQRNRHAQQREVARELPNLLPLLDEEGARRCDHHRCTTGAQDPK